MRIAGGYCFGRFLKPKLGVELKVGFSRVEVGGSVHPICLIVLADNPKEAANEATGGSPNRENENDPTVEAHMDLLSRACQTRTARAMSRRKKMMTEMTKRSVMRTEGFVWIAVRLSAPFW